MRAVWSLWTAPLAGGTHPGWGTPRHHLLSWVLSVRLAREHFAETCLVTDRRGAAMLVDGLGLPFDTVTTSLEALAGWDPEWWAIAKLHACAAQAGPFAHLDNDVFLWKPLAETLLAAPVFAEHPESSELGASCYRPEAMEHALRQSGGWMPEEFMAWMPHGGRLVAPNCGILGGTDLAFLRHFAQTALRFIDHPANLPIWREKAGIAGDAIVFEQLFLAACVQYHAGRRDSPHGDVRIAYLFEGTGQARTEAESRGYTHLVAGAKREPEVLAALERIVARDYPADYARVLALETRS
ncbi:DUF6734 family protein [Humitalea sp. 24SJ18S-53]|uniref:DUF6734 family protein n=1 Tax=Humitalea sp. 24SJ18S-53 TaxID=3422307 RepID=UPI003D6792FE